MSDTIIFIGLIIASIAGFLLSGNRQKKSIGIWDIVFICAFWNFFDTGWWFILDWTQKSEPDLLAHAYMISALPFAIVFLAYVKRRAIDMGPSYQAGLITIPKPLTGLRDLKILALFTVGAVGIVLPIAYVMGFINWAPDLRYERMPLRFLEQLLLVGFVEELVFRGVIQNLLANTFKFKAGKTAAFLLANLLFAFMWTHAGVPEPINWDYIIMAFIMGLFYGGVYLKSGNLWTAAFLHALTNFLWITFFGG